MNKHKNRQEQKTSMASKFTQMTKHKTDFLERLLKLQRKTIFFFFIDFLKILFQDKIY